MDGLGRVVAPALAMEGLKTVSRASIHTRSGSRSSPCNSLVDAKVDDQHLLSMARFRSQGRLRRA